MTQPPSDMPFVGAAHRHLRDAQMLREAERLPNSDHLAGFAAECALKAILVGHLGCTAENGRPPVHPGPPPKTYRDHITKLWPQLGAFATGRTGGMFHAMISRRNPFEHWDLAERYSDGNHIKAARVDAHLEAARETVNLQQQARMNGAIP